jgi:hypothetical protein
MLSPEEHEAHLLSRLACFDQMGDDLSGVENAIRLRVINELCDIQRKSIEVFLAERENRKLMRELNRDDREAAEHDQGVASAVEE